MRVSRYKNNQTSIAFLFEWATFVFFFMRGIANFVVEHSYTKTIVSKEVHPWDSIWYCLYIFAFAVCVAGIVKSSTKVRILAITMLATGLAMNSFASIFYVPYDPRSYGTVFPLVACVAAIAVFCRQNAEMKNCSSPK